jgi:Cu-Zn family superoxide dismutase
MYNKNNYFYNKYFKYKNKYLDLKKNKKGGFSDQNDDICKQTDIIRAIVFFNTTTIKGTVKFEEVPDDLVSVIVNLTGFEPNTTHGFHIHESGDLTNGCDSMCAHFNPYNKTHGGREDDIRHVGDLGNITADSEGNVHIEFTDHLIKLRGDTANIIGRGLVIHEDPDDCGKTYHELSKTTGNSGKRIGCGIIGYSEKCNK